MDEDEQRDGKHRAENDFRTEDDFKRVSVEKIEHSVHDAGEGTKQLRGRVTCC